MKRLLIVSMGLSIIALWAMKEPFEAAAGQSANQAALRAWIDENREDEAALNNLLAHGADLNETVAVVDGLALNAFLK